VAEAIVAEKGAKLRSIDEGAKEGRDRLEALKEELRKARAKYQIAIKLKDECERAYNSNFKVLQEGRFRDMAEAATHIDLLVKLFEHWGNQYDLKQRPSTCLLPGFKVAGKKTPDLRSQWDQQVMTETESLFNLPLAEVAKHTSDCQMEVERLEAMQGGHVADDDGRRLAMEELRVAQEILKRTQELTHFRMHCLEGYRALLETGLAQQSSLGRPSFVGQSRSGRLSFVK
jgi:hypothetical protein